MPQQRILTPSEIKQLEMQGCSSADWSLVTVSENTDLKLIHNSRFSGKISIGEFGTTLYESGIYNSKLHNCSIGNLCLIDNASISNYSVGEKSIIKNVGELSVVGQSTFGNGTDVAVLNETGGREVKIFDHLSAQNAYFQAFYRHRPFLISKLQHIITQYAESVSAETGTVGTNCEIKNCRTLKNIRVGDFATLNGASRLENGTIISSADSPTHIGEDVIAENFIVSSASKIETGTILKNVFVGQGVHLATRFSAVESLFFSYSQGENGEACAVFAGPFTVTHHKSTLLIGGYYSFMNAGSGTNQSNHHYRLGPLHHGILERGCKTASDSYLLWPSRIGAFSLVSGRHKNHVDTSQLPFSYLVENHGESFLIPAATLRNIGTIRDTQKWIKRDTLQASKRLDIINNQPFTPYTMQQVAQAIEVLQGLQQQQGVEAQIYNHQGVKINGSSLRKGMKLYQASLVKYLGNQLIEHLIKSAEPTLSSFLEDIKPMTQNGANRWIDVSGLIVPQQNIEALLSQIEANEVSSFTAIEEKFAQLHSQFKENEWCWAVGFLERKWQKPLDQWTKQDFAQLILEYTAAVQLIHENLLEDAAKEFSPGVSIGYGIDETATIRKEEFEAIRGTLDAHPVVENLRNELTTNKKRAEEALQRISQMKN